MSRAQTQILLILLYGAVGVLSVLAPGTTARIFDFGEAERTDATLYLIRIFGASSILIALLFFFFIVNTSASRRLLLTIAIYEALIITVTLLSLAANDLATRPALISIFGSALLALIAIWGGTFAHTGPSEQVDEAGTDSG